MTIGLSASIDFPLSTLPQSSETLLSRFTFLLRCAEFSRSEDTAKPVMLSSTQDISIRRPCLLPKNEVFSKTYPDWKTTYSSLLKSTYPSIAFFYYFALLTQTHAVTTNVVLSLRNDVGPVLKSRRLNITF